MIDKYGFLGKERLFHGPWNAFERATGRLLIHRGWEHVAIMGGSGDRGADVIASSNNEECVFQVKFRKSGGSVGVEIIDDVKRAMEYYKIKKGCGVTNGYLSIGAIAYYENLKKDNYNISILEGKKIMEISDKLETWPSRAMEMREYQAIAVDKVVKQFERGNRRSLIVLATGLGKTFVAGKFLTHAYRQSRDLTVLFLAHKTDLIRQLEVATWPHLPKHVATHLWDQSEKPAFNTGVTFATFQSIAAALDRGNDLPYYNIVIVDECHHAAADTYEQIIKTFDPSFMLGMTATPFRADNREINNIFGAPVFEMGIIEGMRHGYLSKVDYRVLTDNIDWEAIPSLSKKQYSINDLNKRLFLPQRDDSVLDHIKETWVKFKCKRGIIFCASIAHCKVMEKRLLDCGFRGRGLYFGLDQREREAYLREFRAGGLDFLLAVDILNEGIDIPEVDLVVFLRVTHSRLIFLQQLGRGLRIAAGKQRVVVLDFVADIRRVAGIINITQGGYDREDYQPEKINLTEFNVKFSDAKTATLFEELVKDKLDIENCDETEELFLGGHN